MLLGLILPDEGRARVDGVNVVASPRTAYQSVSAMLEGARNVYWRLTVMLATTDRALTLDVLAVVPIVVVTILSTLGVGFLFAGLTLLYKRIENVNQLMKFVFIGLIATPSEGLNPLSALPLHHGSYVLYRSMSDGLSLLEFPAADLLVLLATGVGYLAVSYGAFSLFVRRARKLGVMGHY